MAHVPNQPEPDPSLDPIREASLKYRPEAQIVEQALPALVLSAITGDTLKTTVSTPGYKSYIDKVLEDAGSPTDPIERQWLEQETWAHATIGNLLSQAARTQSPEAIKALTTSAARLLAEHRKTGLARREYHAPTAQNQITLVHQQNVAAGNQHVAMVDGRPQEPSEATSDIELGSNGLLSHVELAAPFAPTNRRETEPFEAPGFFSGSPEEAQRRGTEEPSVDAIDWPQNGSR